MKNTLFVIIFALSITACGGSNGHSTNVDNNHTPSVEEVTITGKGETGSSLTGSYQFNDLAKDGDASESYWLHPNGTTITSGKTLVPNASLVGWSIKFCVKAISAGKRLEGNISCSEGIIISEPRILVMPKISIANQATNTIVGASLYALALEDYDYSISYHWFINDKPLQGESSPSLVLDKAWQGQRAHVCINDQVTKNVLACTEKTGFIKARSNYAPHIQVSLLDPYISVGDSLQADFAYSDADGDEEDENRRSYRWYLNGKLISSAAQLIINELHALKSIKVCITAYSQTGLPDTTGQQCTRSRNVWFSESKVPAVTAIKIKGIAMEGYKLGASYTYFDGNNHSEAGSDKGWYVNDVKIEESEELLLTANIVDNNTQVEYCVTPTDTSGQSGAKTCQSQDFAQIETEGALHRGSIIIPKLTNYPEFSLSWWKSPGGIDVFHEFENNKVKPWHGSSYGPSITVNFRELVFCIQAKKLNGESTDICTTLSRDHGLTYGAEIDKDNLQRIGFDPQPEINVTVNGSSYTVYRPVSEAEFNRLASGLKLASPEAINLGNLTSIKMTATDALAYCQRSKPLGQIASREVINKLFLDSELSAFILWPTPYNTPWLSADNDSNAVTLSEFEVLNPANKYPFSCMSPL